MTDIELLQFIRLKGLTTAAAIVESLGHDAADVATRTTALLEAGLLADLASRMRLSPEGRSRLAELVAAERATLDNAVIQATYADFCVVNDALKSTITAWQMRDVNTPNNHDDAVYDASVIERLKQADRQAAPLLAQLALLAPRLARYHLRFAAALSRIDSGEFAYVAKPIIDSYHTVWFELHEDLLALSGRNRADEAAAGRAA